VFSSFSYVLELWKSHWRQQHLQDGPSSRRKRRRKKEKKKRLRKFSSARVHIRDLESSVYAYSQFAYMCLRAWECGESCNACVHMPIALRCVRACMNARSSISDAYKCAPSVKVGHGCFHTIRPYQRRARTPLVCRIACPPPPLRTLLLPHNLDPLFDFFSHASSCPSASLFLVGNIKRLSNPLLLYIVK